MESTHAESLLDANDDEYYAHDTPHGITLKMLCVQTEITPENISYEQCARQIPKKTALAYCVFAHMFWYNHAQAPTCLLYTSPSPRDKRQSRMPSSA